MSVWCYSLLERTKFSKISPVESKDKIPSNPCGFFYNRCNGAPAWAYVSSTFEIQTDSKRVRNSLRMLSPVTAIIKSAWFSVILSALFIQFLLAEFCSSKHIRNFLQGTLICYSARNIWTHVTPLHHRTPAETIFSAPHFFLLSLSFEWRQNPFEIRSKGEE